jgi:uncharacterized membrane protein YeaQ/YmgE (transglycosylase-associated protein family)
MGILSWICFGFFAGLVARAVMPGTQGMGFVLTTVLGIAGAFVGGILGSLLSGGVLWREVQPAGFIGSVIGAIVILALRGILGSGRSR